MTYKEITSTQHELVKDAVALHRTRGRQKAQAFLAEGKRTCETFLQGGYKVVYLFITSEHLQWVQQQNVPAEKIIRTTTKVIEKISNSETPSGIIGIFEMPRQKNQPLTPGIVLAQIQDPGNMGTLIRSAAAFGKSVVVVEGTDPYNPKVIQASAGTLALTSLRQISWEDLVQQARQESILLTALVVKGRTQLEELPEKPRLLVVGNEALGLPEKWLLDCTERATLSMPGGTESLNAAVAGSIALYITRNKAQDTL